MLIYEINLKINIEIYPKYLEWLKNHIKEILAMPGFTKALLLTESETSNEELINITVQYYVDSEENLDNYLINHSQRMRADGLTKFPNKFTATRRILKVFDIISK